MSRKLREKSRARFERALAELQSGGSPKLKAFKAEVRRKLAAAGVDTLQEWAEKRPGEHLPARFGTFPSCALCCAVQPYGGFKSRCKGIVRVTMRARPEPPRGAPRPCVVVPYDLPEPYLCMSLQEAVEVLGPNEAHDPSLDLSNVFFSRGQRGVWLVPHPDCSG